MKEHQYATNNSRRKRQRWHPTVAQCILAMLLGGWLLMVECYIWFTKMDTLVDWIIDLHQVWTGCIIGAAGTLLILFEQNRIKIRKKFIFINFLKRFICIAIGVFRTFELLLTLYHLDIFLSWWPKSFLSYASVGWLIATVCLLLGLELYDKLRNTQH